MLHGWKLIRGGEEARNYMAKRSKKRAVPLTVGEVVAIANIARSNPFIQQLLHDPKLRKNVQTAVASSKQAYSRVSNGKVPTARVLLEDKKLHDHVGRALTAARDVTITITNTPRKRKRRRLTFGRVLVLGIIGTAVAMVASGSLRSKVLDMLFGAEEEFQYTPPPNSTATGSSSATVSAA
jgi:hypothetical protein